MFKKLFTKEDGFTLVELLVTIAILAVLFGITTLTLSGVGANAQSTVMRCRDRCRAISDRYLFSS